MFISTFHSLIFYNDNSDRSDILLPVAMKEIVRVPVSPLQNNVIDESLVNVPETQMLVIKPLNGGMRFIKNNSGVLHTVIILVNTHLTRIFLPPWHNESSVGVNLITLDAFSDAKVVIK